MSRRANHNRRQITLVNLLMPAALLLAACAGSSTPRDGDAEGLAQPTANSVTFWGHASCYIDVGGVGIVTDPVFENSYGLVFPRRTAAPPPTAYAGAKLVLISHAHPDHLSPRTLATFPEDATILCSAESAGYLSELDLRLQIMRPGDSFEFTGGDIVAVPAHHPGGRLSLISSSDGGALGYIIRTRDTTVYYTGDTEYFEGLVEIATTYRPDLTLLNLNGHLHSAEAFRAAETLGESIIVPIHYGAFAGTNDARGTHWRREIAEELAEQVLLLDVGESLPLDIGAAAPLVAEEQLAPASE